MNLELKKPIVFFDIESTGINVAHDRIIEIALLKVHPDGTKENRRYLVNPCVPIPPETTEIHGISDDDVKDKPSFKMIAKELSKFIEGCDLGGFNSNKFDIPLLAEEFLRADIDIDLKRHKAIDVQVIFHKMEQRTLSAAYQFYCNKELVDAHTAEADTLATFEILDAQIAKYNELSGNVSELSEFSSHKRNVDFAGRIVLNEDDLPVFNFGKYNGELVKEVLKKDPNYFAWMMNGDFPLYTKKVLTRIKLESMQK
jgi:DNA polymerase III subunit epsilon